MAERSDTREFSMADRSSYFNTASASEGIAEKSMYSLLSARLFFVSPVPEYRKYKAAATTIRKTPRTDTQRIMDFLLMTWHKEYQLQIYE